MGQYRNLFLRGAYPSLKKKKMKEYKKNIYYNNNIVELSIQEIDNPLLIEKQLNQDIFRANIQQDGIIALFVIDATDHNSLIELNATIEELKLNYTDKEISINEYILLGIIPKSFSLEQNFSDDMEDPMPFFVFHKLGEKQNCFCYEMEESEEEMDYNLFFANYAMFFWIDFDKIYSNEELREIIDKNTGSENKDIKIKCYTEKELKQLEEKKKKIQLKEINLINKEKDKLESSMKKLTKIKSKEESKKQNIIFDSIKKKYSNRKSYNFDEIKEKFKKRNSNSTNMWCIFEESKKNQLIELYNKEYLNLLRCIYCNEIPEIQILNDKNIKIKCANYKDENHIGKKNLINLNQYEKIINEYNDKKEINYNKNKCMHCYKNQNDIFHEILDFINLEQKEIEDISYEELKDNFFYYYNENKIFFCNICRNIICQKCKNYHILLCKSKNDITTKNNDIPNTYENYEEIKSLIDEKIVDYETEINLNRQFMPLYMFDTFCIKHKRPYNYYCENCNLNLCSDCINHNKHKILNWIDFENILILKNEELQKEKTMINNLATKIAECIQDINNYFKELLKQRIDILNLKERIILNAKSINNNYNIYKNLKNIEFNLKKFDDNKFNNEKNVMKKIDILLDYFNESYLLINKKLFNEKTEEQILKNISMVNNNHNIYNNNGNSNYCITSLINFNEEKNENFVNLQNKENIGDDKYLNDNIFAFSTNNGDVNFYNIKKNGKSEKIISFYLFNKYNGIFDMKKIKYNGILCGGYEQLKIVDIELNKKRYNIIKIIKKEKNYFIKNWQLNRDYILSYFSNKEFNLIKLNNSNNDNVIDNGSDIISWYLLDTNNSQFNNIIDSIKNKNYELISLIKLKNGKYLNRFVISISTSIIAEKNNSKDFLIFYHLDEKNKIIFEKILILPKINHNENNLFEIYNNNILICLLESPIKSAAIINSNDFKIEKIIKLYNNEFYQNNNIFDIIFFTKYKSIYFKGDYYFSFNRNIDLVQWKFDIIEKEFIPIDNLSLSLIKNNNKFLWNKETIIHKVLFFQECNTLIVLSNDNLILPIFLET